KVANVAWDKIREYLPNAVGQHFVSTGKSVQYDVNFVRSLPFSNELGSSTDKPRCSRNADDQAGVTFIQTVITCQFLDKCIQERVPMCQADAVLGAATMARY